LGFYFGAERRGILSLRIAVEPKRKDRAKMRGWLGAGCALALMYACVSPRGALAQTSASTSKTGATKTGTKTANPKKHAKAAANDSAANTTTSPRRPHPASHPAADKHPKSNVAAAAHNSKSKRGNSRKNSNKKKTTARGQQKIDPERAQAIQEALIHEHYLSGEAAGTWNQSSEEAMRRYQADHGWQSKTVPDSRALISLGLGPSHDHLLNPESAMTTGPFPPRAASLTPVSHSADPGARMNTSPSPSADPAPAPTSGHDATGPQ
jgi:hypothetical protein